MKTFEYRGYNADGRSCRGLVEALSIKHAREKLAAQGVFTEKLLVSGRHFRFSTDNRAVMYREIGVLLSAGLTIEKALELLIQSSGTGDRQILLAGVRDRIREGNSFAAALAEICGSISPFEKAIIDAAEKSATVDIMLERLADFIEEQDRLKSRIISALFYPVIIVTVAIIVAVILLCFFVPWARNFLAENNVPLPWLTEFMMTLGKIIARGGIPFVIVMIVVVSLMRKRISSDEAFRNMLDSRIYKLPLIGRGYITLVNIRFSKTMAILLGGGVPLIESLVLSGRATGSPWVAGMADREADLVRHGGALSEAVSRIPPLADSLPGWIQTGEASGELERLLNSAGRRYQDQWTRYTERLLTVIEPVLILLVGVFVLLVILSVLLPVINMSQGIGR